MNILSKVFFEGWTTKKAIKVTTMPAQKEGQEPMSYAFVQIIQDRPYSLIAKDAKGNILYEADGKTPKRYVPSDAITLKFRNGSSQAIAKFKPEGMSRKIQGIGHIETFQTKQNYVMVENGTGRLVRKELFYYDSTGKRVDIYHVVTSTIIVVDEWQFCDNKRDEVMASQPASQDLNAAVCLGDPVANIANEQDLPFPADSENIVPPAIQDEEATVNAQVMADDDLPPFPEESVDL